MDSKHWTDFYYKGYKQSYGGLGDGDDTNDIRAQVSLDGNTCAPHDLSSPRPSAFHLTPTGEPTSPLLHLKKKMFHPSLVPENTCSSTTHTFGDGDVDMDAGHESSDHVHNQNTAMDRDADSRPNNNEHKGWDKDKCEDQAGRKSPNNHGCGGRDTIRPDAQCQDISNSDGPDNSAPSQVAGPAGQLNTRAFKKGCGGPSKVRYILHSNAYWWLFYSQSLMLWLVHWLSRSWAQDYGQATYWPVSVMVIW